MRKLTPSIQAILIACLGWFSFNVADAASKWLTQDYHAHQIIALNAFFGLILLCVWIISQRGLKGFYTPYWRWHLLRGVFVVGTSFCVVSALSYIPLSQFYAIVFLQPILTGIMAIFILGERLTTVRLLVTLTGFAGVLVITGLDFSKWNTGVYFALCVPFFIASAIMVLRKKIGADEYLPHYALFQFLLMFLFNAPLSVPHFEMPALNDIWLFLIYGPAVIAGQIFFALGQIKAPAAAIVAPFHYTQMIWGILIGIVIFSEWPTLQTLAGAGIIILSGLYLMRHEYVKDRLRPSRRHPFAKAIK